MFSFLGNVKMFGAYICRSPCSQLWPRALWNLAWAVITVPSLHSKFLALSLYKGTIVSASSYSCCNQYYKLSDLKQYKFIIFRFLSPKSHWATIKVLAGLCSFLEVVGENSISLPFPPFRGHSNCVGTAPFLYLWSQQHTALLLFFLSHISLWLRLRQFPYFYRFMWLDWPHWDNQGGGD